MRYAGVLVVIALATIGCGDNLQYGPAEYVAALDDAVCEREVRCGLLTSDRECARVFAPRWFHPDVVDAIEAGTIVFHPDAAQECVARIREQTCDWTSAGFRNFTCPDVTTGTLGDGEPCALASECISEECWFDSSPCTDACCIGTCAGSNPPQSGHIGDECRYARCLEGWCDGNTCQPHLSEGAACERSEQCDYGLECNLRLGTCTRSPGPGEDCWGSCRELGLTCSVRYTCVPAGTLGSPCTRDQDCSSYYACGVYGRCEPRQRPAIGDSCTFANCADPNAVCSWATGRCMLPLADGERCNGSSECASHRCSDAGVCTSEVCIAPSS